jgi:hypothetical protein
VLLLLLLGRAFFRLVSFSTIRFLLLLLAAPLVRRPLLLLLLLRLLESAAILCVPLLLHRPPVEPTK